MQNPYQAYVMKRKIQDSSSTTDEMAIARLVQFVVISLIFILMTRTLVDADVWWHLRAGQIMWQQKQILLTDVFSYTQAGAPWVNAFWLSEVLLYLFYSVGGYFGLTLFVSTMAAITFYLISRRLEGNPFLNGFILILAAMTAAPIWGPRPQIISFFIIAFMDGWIKRNRPLWILPILFAIWANLHGGWIWGFLLLFAQIAGNLLHLITIPEKKNEILKSTKDLSLWTAVSTLAIGLNPNGLSIWKLPFQQVDVSMQIQEWLSPDFHRIDFHPFLWMIFLLLLMASFAPRHPDWAQIFKSVGFAYLTFVAQRNIALFAIVATPLLSSWVNNAFQAFWKEKRLTPRPSLSPPIRNFINGLLVSCLLIVALGNAYLVSLPEKVEANYPVEAINWIKSNHPEGHLFNSYNWGGYLLWNLPDYPVFIDGRADLYGTDLIEQWQDVVNGNENAQSILDQWDVNLILIEPYWDIANRLQGSGWQVVFQDEKSVILIRE